MGGVVGRLCSSEWGKEFEASGICKLGFAGVGMERGRKSDSVTLRNFAALVKFLVNCLYGSLLQEFRTTLQK